MRTIYEDIDNQKWAGILEDELSQDEYKALFRRCWNHMTISDHRPKNSIHSSNNTMVDYRQRRSKDSSKRFTSIMEGRYFFPPAYLTYFFTRLFSIPRFYGKIFDNYVVSYRRFIRMKNDPIQSHSSSFYCGLMYNDDYSRIKMLDDTDGYSLLICIQKDKTLDGGNLKIYPNQGNEDNIDVDVLEKSAFLIRSNMRYSLQPLTGSGTMQIIRIDMYVCLAIPY